MDKIKFPYKKFKKLKDNNVTERFIFSNLFTNQIMFQGTLTSMDDYVSINYNALESHYNYGYRYQIMENNKWINISSYKNIFVEFEDYEKKINYSFNHYKDSKKLFVIFSSSNEPSRYNYFNSFKNVEENKLYLCDEVIDNTKYKCSYYYGSNGNNYYEKRIITLIMDKIKILGLEKRDVVLVGSSKGGFASLYYLFKYKFSYAIVGSPTIFLGKQHFNSVFGNKLITHLTGLSPMEGSKVLDELIVEGIRNSSHRPKIYYHVGSGESRYRNHALPFKEQFLKNLNGELHLDLGDYSSHSEVGKYFAEYIKVILSKTKGGL